MAVGGPSNPFRVRVHVVVDHGGGVVVVTMLRGPKARSPTPALVAHQLRVDVFVAGRGAGDAADVHAPFVGESALAHKRLIRRKFMFTSS